MHWTRPDQIRVISVSFITRRGWPPETLAPPSCPALENGPQRVLGAHAGSSVTARKSRPFSHGPLVTAL